MPPGAQISEAPVAVALESRIRRAASEAADRSVPTTNVVAIVSVMIVATKRGFSVSNRLIRAATGIPVILFVEHTTHYG
jgi:hypothetical protein